MMKISVCLIVKNEENNLARALASIPEHYEIIVVDTGSTDRTIEVAEQFGAFVHRFNWQDDFAAARNYAASFATGQYILVMDADEELPPDTDEKIRVFIDRYPNRAGCVFILNKMDGEWSRHRMVRFYPNSRAFQFYGIVHEQVYVNAEPASFQMLPIEIVHYGYEQQEYDSKEKSARYMPLYEKYLGEHPNDGYMLYQTGKLYVGMKDWWAAERYLRAGIHQKQEARLYYPVMLVMLGYVLKEQNRNVEAEQLLLPYRDIYPDFPDLFFLLGLLAMDNGKMTDIEAYFTEALRIGDTDKYTSVFGTGSFKAAYNLGVYYEVSGNMDLAVQCYEYAAQYEYEPAISRLK